MQPQRETTTSSLASLIQILQLGYRTGTLTVERHVGGELEEGYLVFANGKIVAAHAKQGVSGTSAFNYLRNWGACRFSFLEGAASGTSPSMQSSSSLPANGSRGPLTTPPYRSFSVNTGPLNQGAMHQHERPGGPLLPTRSATGEAALYNPSIARLTRQQRHLLMLIDGQRNLAELARLIARTPDDVQVILDELENAGLIR